MAIVAGAVAASGELVLSRLGAAITDAEADFEIGVGTSEVEHPARSKGMVASSQYLCMCNFRNRFGLTDDKYEVFKLERQILLSNKWL